MTGAEPELAGKLIADLGRHSRSWPRDRLINLAPAAMILGIAGFSCIWCMQGGRQVFTPFLPPGARKKDQSDPSDLTDPPDASAKSRPAR
jgi:hypothetical protein